MRSAAFSVNGKGFLLREERWAYIAYGERGKGGEELFDMYSDPEQVNNLSIEMEHAEVLLRMRKQLKRKLAQLRTNDLGLTY